MNVFVIDDDAAMLRVVSDLLARVGHKARAFSQPAEALAQINHEVDLVISDVFMPSIDGFAVASRVAAILGNSPPRTLLMSGGEHIMRLQQSLPETVVGLLHKPPELARFREIMDMLSATRNRCPGLVCQLFRGGRLPDEACKKFGEGTSYSRCQYYNGQCGAALREWIHAGQEKKISV